MKEYFINDLIKYFDITRDAIRHYEKLGLISPQRNSNNYRIYHEEDIGVITDILILKKLGISLKNIKNILKKKDKTEILEVQILEIQKQILELKEKEKLLKNILNKKIISIECKDLLKKLIK